VVPFFEFPVYILGFEYFTNARFENQGVIDTRDLFRLKDTFELNASIGKMPDDGKMIFFLHPFFQRAFVDKGKPPGYGWRL
jgi:hypothetical protein